MPVSPGCHLVPSLFRSVASAWLARFSALVLAAHQPDNDTAHRPSACGAAPAGSTVRIRFTGLDRYVDGTSQLVAGGTTLRATQLTAAVIAERAASAPTASQ